MNAVVILFLATAATVLTVLIINLMNDPDMKIVYLIGYTYRRDRNKGLNMAYDWLRELEANYIKAMDAMELRALQVQSIHDDEMEKLEQLASLTENRFIASFDALKRARIPVDERVFDPRLFE